MEDPSYMGVCNAIKNNDISYVKNALTWKPGRRKAFLGMHIEYIGLAIEYKRHEIYEFLINQK